MEYHSLLLANTSPMVHPTNRSYKICHPNDARVRNKKTHTDLSSGWAE
jgi:hypothetical protein